MSELNFEQDVRIDKNSLDEELTDQSQLLFWYDEEMNEQKEILSDLELHLSITESEVAYAIRAGSYGYDGKITESVVKELIDKDEDIVALKQKIISQKRVVSKTASAAEAIRQRRYMLQKLVDLYIYEYYNGVKPEGSKPRMAGGTSVEEEQLNGLSRKRVREAMEDEE